MKLVEQHGPTYKAVIITRYVSSVYSADYQWRKYFLVDKNIWLKILAQIPQTTRVKEQTQLDASCAVSFMASRSGKMTSWLKKSCFYG